MLEYALRGLANPIGVSEYELTRVPPEELTPTLPTIDEIEPEIAEAVDYSDGIDAGGEVRQLVQELAAEYRVERRGETR